jgi:hypothetical protein
MPQKEWTIMIYMAGDNNLAVDMAYALEQIKEVAAQGEESPNLFVYYDGNSPSIPTLYCDFSENNRPRYVRSYKVPNKLCYVPKKENENAADRRSILNFVDWCVNKVEVENNGEISYGRRAKRYALIFSGHSLGFQDIGLFKDESSGKSMKMRDFYDVLQNMCSSKQQLVKDAKGQGWNDEEYAQQTTVLLGQKLDILGFDSCVMGMLEVGYQFNFVAKTMIASEGSLPSAGWTYAKILGCLTRSDAETAYVAQHFVQDFIKTQDNYTVGGVSVDLAAWDLDQIANLAVAFDSLAEVLLQCFAEPDSCLYRQMERVILKVHWECQSYMYDQNVDLGDFCELLDQECGRVLEETRLEGLQLLEDIRSTCCNLLEELRKTVILSGFSGGAYQYSNGISVFFPWSREAYEVSKKNYESLWFAKDVKRRSLSWTDFLKKYLNQVSLRRVALPAEGGPIDSRHRYYSGVKFDERDPFGAAGNLSLATKIAGQEGSKIAGQEGSKIAGQEGSKIAGQEGSKLAGTGPSAFFNSLRLFKNIESRWDISGFTRKPD